MNLKPLIFVFGDSPTANTGFGTVNKHVFRRLKDKYRLVFLGINFDGSPLPETKEFNIYPCNQDPFGRDKFKGLLASFKPDLLFTLNDYDALTWLPKDLIEVRNIIKKEIPWVFYFPIDGSPVYRQYIDFIKTYVDVPFTVTKFGQKTILETNPDFKLDYIYHGVDSALFKPRELNVPIHSNGPTIKQEKQRLGIDNTFNILMVGVNQIRKQYNIAIEAFYEFARDKEDVRLILHCARNTSYGWDLDALIGYFSDKDTNKSLAFKNKIMFTNGIVGPLGILEQELALLYNFSDIFLNTSIGEGFCLPLLEAMSSGLPIITHNATAMPEVVGDSGLFVDTAFKYIFPFQDRTLIRPIPDKDQITQHLNEIYENKELKESLGIKARERVISEARFNWDYVAHETDKKIQEGLEDKRTLDLSATEIL